MPESLAPSGPRPSLRVRLLGFLMIPMLALLLLDAALTYTVALRYAERVHDRDLSEDALSLATFLNAEQLQGPLSRQAQALLGFGVDGRSYLLASSQKHGLLGGNVRFEHPPPTHAGAPPVLFDTSLGGHPLRAASVSLQSLHEGGDTLNVIIAESLDERQLHAREILLLAVPLQALLIVCVLALVWFGVNRGLRSLAPLMHKLAAREQGLSPITDADVPQEILPLTRTIDGLFARLREALEVQEQFIADAAHQLRTPLSGLRLHVERAIADPRPESVREALEHVARLTERASRTATQLLALTRAQLPLDTPEQHSAIVLTRLVPEVIASRVHDAIRAGIDLGYQGPDTDVTIEGEAAGLHELIDNLVDNALRYAGRGSTVTVSVQEPVDDMVALVIEDDGPGVPDQYLARLGERFFRVPGAREGGTGLGLAIVQSIAQRQGATLEFARGAQRGLRVTVRFPCPARRA